MLVPNGESCFEQILQICGLFGMYDKNHLIFSQFTLNNFPIRFKILDSYLRTYIKTLRINDTWQFLESVGTEGLRCKFRFLPSIYDGTFYA